MRLGVKFCDVKNRMGRLHPDEGKAHRREHRQAAMKNRKRKTCIALRVAIIATILTALTGCAAVWGKPYKVDFASVSSITINFDPSLTNMGEVQNVAQEHCAQFGKDAIPQASQDSVWGLRNMSFLCKRRE